MKKVVYNGCFGGFGLSAKAQRRYLELLGKQSFFYKQTKWSFQREKVNEYTKVENLDKASSYCYVSLIDFGDVTQTFDWDNLFHYSDLDRKDPILVQVVEELGFKEASGDCAELCIAELNDDEMYRITEYDGNESIETMSTIDWDS